MKVVRMMSVLRRGLFSLAAAGLFAAGAVLSGQGAMADVPHVDTLADRVVDRAAQPILPVARPTYISSVVCDEGLGGSVACRVPVTLGADLPAEATTYDQRAVAGKDYLPLQRVPVKVLDREGSAEIFVDLLDDKECESIEDFLVAVTGPEIQLIIPVSIVDNDC